MENELCLVTLQTHIARLTQLFGELSSSTNNASFSACWSNLHLAASLRSLGVDTDVFGDGLWCSSVSEYQSAVDEIGGRFVAGRLIYELVFHAYESLGELFCTACGSVTSRQITRKFIETERHQPLVGLMDVAFEAVGHPPVAFDLNTQDAKAAIKNASYVALAAEVTRQFRNALVHGNFSMLEPEDWGPKSNDKTAGKQTSIFRWHIRLCLLLIQVMCQRSAGTEELEVSETLLRVDEVITSLHRQDQQDNDEDDPEQHSFASFCAVPRFNYWLA